MKVNFSFTLDESDRLRWTQFWETCHHSHARQHLLFGEVERAKGRIPVYAYGEVNGRIVCGGIFSIRPLLFGKKFSMEAICLRGPAFDDLAHGELLLREVLSRFKVLNVGRVRVSPYWYFPEAENVALLLDNIGFVPVDGYTRVSTGLINLKRDEQEIFLSFDRKTRQQIKAAQRLGVSIAVVTEIDEARKAYICLRSMRKKRGILPMSEKEFFAVFDYVLKNQEMGILFNAKIGSIFLGGLWNIRSPHISNPSGYALITRASKDIPSSFSIGPALWWEMLKWAKAKGCSFFDTEGSVEKGDPSSASYEVRKFKRRFGPSSVDLLNQHVYVCNSATNFVFLQFCSFERALRAVMKLPYLLDTRLRSRRKVVDNSKASGRQ